MRKYYDMLVRDGNVVEELKDLGWCEACFVGVEVEPQEDFEVLSAAPVSGDVSKNARQTLEKHDLSYVMLSNLDANRKASECWEVDAFVISEDYVRECKPGKKILLDYVSLKNMSDRGIALIFPLNILLSHSGYSRATALDCLKKTVFLARKAKVNIILASGAGNPKELRSPLDLTYVGKVIGLPENEATKAVSENPCTLTQKAKDRKNPNIILAGLTVVEWGEQEPHPTKKQFGWY